LRAWMTTRCRTTRRPGPLTTKVNRSPELAWLVVIGRFTSEQFDGQPRGNWTTASLLRASESELGA
jgi:hypothetical protein